MILIQFNDCSLTVSEDNLVECYLNKHYDCQSYRIVVKDSSLVSFNYYSCTPKLASFEIGQKTIYEGSNNDIPHIYIRS